MGQLYKATDADELISRFTNLLHIVRQQDFNAADGHSEANGAIMTRNGQSLNVRTYDNKLIRRVDGILCASIQSRAWPGHEDQTVQMEAENGIQFLPPSQLI